MKEFSPLGINHTQRYSPGIIIQSCVFQLELQETEAFLIACNHLSVVYSRLDMIQSLFVNTVALTV